MPKIFLSPLAFNSNFPPQCQSIVYFVAVWCIFSEVFYACISKCEQVFPPQE